MRMGKASTSYHGFGTGMVRGKILWDGNGIRETRSNLSRCHS